MVAHARRRVLGPEAALIALRSCVSTWVRALSLLLALAACTAAPVSTPIPTLQPCDANRVRSLYSDFVSAFNAHDAAGVSEVFTFAYGFYYSDGLAVDGDEVRVQLYDREQLQRYLAERFALDERLELVRADVPEGAALGATLSPLFRRTSRVGTYETAGSKVICSAGKLHVWVMAWRRVP